MVLINVGGGLAISTSPLPRSLLTRWQPAPIPSTAFSNRLLALCPSLHQLTMTAPSSVLRSYLVACIEAVIASIHSLGTDVPTALTLGCISQVR